MAGDDILENLTVEDKRYVLQTCQTGVILDELYRRMTIYEEKISTISEVLMNGKN